MFSEPKTTSNSKKVRDSIKTPPNKKDSTKLSMKLPMKLPIAEPKTLHKKKEKQSIKN